MREMAMEKNKNIQIRGRLLDKAIQIPELTVLIPVIVVFVAATFLSPAFLNFNNILSLIRSSTYIGIVAIFMTLLLMSKGLDLSCDSAAAMSSVIFANALVNQKMLTFEGLLLALGVASMLGLLNSTLILRAKIPSFVATLGTKYIALGIGFVVCSGYSISGLPIDLQKFINIKVCGVTIDIIMFIAIVVVVDFILRHTTVGRKIMLIGINEDAAVLSGIKAKKIVTVLYICTALSACIAALMFTCRSTMGMLDCGNNWSLQAITGCVIGGTSIYGGKGSILGTVLGVLFMGMISNIMILCGISAEWQNVGVGVFMVAGILLDLYRSHKLG